MADTYRLVLGTEHRDPLEKLATSLGMIWGSRGNVTAMIVAIANGELSVKGGTTLDDEYREAIGRAAITAVANGNWPDALILEKGFLHFEKMDDSLSGAVGATFEPLKRPWVSRLINFIEEQQPFKLGYYDAADRPFEFTVCGAELTVHEKRIYLDCWCEETEGNRDIPELQHNWCLRLDRIINAEVIEIEGDWRSLDSIELVMRLTGGLRHGYEKRTDDISLQREEDSILVTRKVTNTFWLIREILRYGRQCEILSPPELRDRVADEIRAMVEAYE